MLEFLIVVLLTGFVLYYLMRHPLRSLKYASIGIGLMVLGLAGITGAVVLAAAIFS